MPIAEDSAGGSPVPIPTNLTTNLTGEATGSGTLDYTTGDIDIAVTVVDNGHNHILSNITDVQVNNAISGQILVYNGTVWANATNTSGITAIVQDLTPQLGGNLDLNGKNINGNGNINLADNYKLTLGTGNDLEISHDGVSSYIRDVGAGDLQIFASDDVYIRGQGSNTYMARFNESGAVTLYHNNVVRLITTDSGITVTDEVEAVEFIGPLRGPTKFKGQAGEALSAGDPVYISGISGNTTVVSKADANNASKMPAFGIIDASVSANASCQVITFGEMHNLDTSAFSEGDELYVSNTGTLTTTIPSGESSQIQKIAKVTRSHASAGGIFIMGAGRSNAVPNLDNGDIFIGDGTNHATTTSLNTAVNALTLTNYLPLSGGAMTGNITTSGTFDGRDVSVDGAKLDGIATGADVTLNEISAGTNVTISAGGVISSTASGGLAHVVDDTTPQLGGNLSLNSHDITGTGNLNFTGSVTLSGTVDGRDVAADGTKLDGIEASADVTDTANVTAAGALMDSEVTNLAQVKAFDSSDYATAAQGTTADAALPKAGGTMTGDILFNDGVKAKFGTSSDLQIYHDGSNSIIDDSGTGNLYIRSNDVLIDKYTGERMIRAIADGAVTLYYDNAEKLATTSTGIDVTGAIDVATSGASNTSKGIAISTSGTNFESDGGIISIDHAASGAVTGGYFSKYSAGGTLRHSVKGDGKGYFAGGIDVTGATNTTGTSNTRQWSVGTAGAKMGVYALDNSTMYMRVESGSSTNFQFGTYDNIPIYTITNNTVRTALLGNGNFGVGHTSPVAKMAILGTSNSTITEANSNLCVEGSGGNGMLFGTLNTTGFKSYIQSGYVSSLSAATYDLLLNPEGGNVGVGLSAPTAKMHLFTDGIDQSVFSAQTDLGANNRILTLKSPVSDSGSAPYRWQTSNSIQWEIDTTETKSMLLNSAGNLGVGTYSPTHKLSVAGELNTTGSIYLNSGTADSPQVVWRSSGYGDQYIDNFQGNLRVVNSGAQQVTIKQGGNVGIGTSAPTAKLSVAGNVNVSNALNVGGASAAGSGFIESTVVGPSRALQTVGNVNTTQTHIGFENLYGEIGRIDVSAFSVSYVTSSDYRLKTDIQPMQGSIDRVKALKPVNFEWKEDGTRVDGFLAHEAQEIVPEAVSGEKDATKTNKDGVEVPDYQGIDQSKLVPLLTSALQEALAKIDDLELRMANLEN